MVFRALSRHGSRRAFQEEAARVRHVARSITNSATCARCANRAGATSCAASTAPSRCCASASRSSPPAARAATQRRFDPRYPLAIYEIVDTRVARRYGFRGSRSRTRPAGFLGRRGCTPRTRTHATLGTFAISRFRALDLTRPSTALLRLRASRSAQDDMARPLRMTWRVRSG